jgi:hypothetical protein
LAYLSLTFSARFIHAARIYEQLGQHGNALRHLNHAAVLDPTLAMTRVEIAQVNLQLNQKRNSSAPPSTSFSPPEGVSNSATDSILLLDQAMGLAKHVSEIRDVLTARTVALIQANLESAGVM